MNSQLSEESRYFSAVADSYDRLQPILAGPSYSKGLDMIVQLIPFAEDDAFEFAELRHGRTLLARAAALPPRERNVHR